jgi:ribosomal protein L19
VNILSVPKKSMELLAKVCPEKTRLLNAYQEAAMAHSTALLGQFPEPRTADSIRSHLRVRNHSSRSAKSVRLFQGYVFD